MLWWCGLGAGGIGWPEDPVLAVREVVRLGMVTPVLQPVVDLRTGTIIGYEALARGPAGSPVHEAPDLFEAARRAGVALELEALCRRRALEAKRSHLGQGLLIFVNVDLHAGGQRGPGKGFQCEWLEELGIDRREVVLEMSERLEVSGRSMRSKVAGFHRYGFRVALDDVGAGRWSLESLPETASDLSPHFVKLDIQVVHGLEEDAARAERVRILAQYCRTRGIGLVAEGIDSAARLRLLASLGVPYGQGFFLGMPVPVPCGLEPRAAEAIRTLEESLRYGAAARSPGAGRRAADEAGDPDRGDSGARPPLDAGSREPGRGAPPSGGA